MKTLRKTNIIGTIGPASESEEMLTNLMNAGLNVTRINFSHGGYEENATKIATIKKVRKALNRPVALVLDTKGPEIRTGKLESGDEKVTITEGDVFTFVHDDIIGNATKATVSYKDLYKDVKVGAKILVDDGAIEFEVTEIKGQDIVCKALNTGRLGSRKTMNVPGLKLNLPALSPKDIDDITKGVKAGFDYIAASFVRRADDVNQIRKLLDDNGGQQVGIISKIESQEGIDNFEEILKLSDAIMVARGDMGVEIPMEDVPVVQKHFIKRCNEVGKPVVTATQMLESMISNPRPTRAEVSDVANAVYDRTSCIMLSGECAMGKYPVECVATMNKIASRIEKEVNYTKRMEEKKDLVSAADYAKCEEAKDADAIVVYTKLGSEACHLAGVGPACPIIAVTDCEKTFNKLSLAWNVVPVYVEGKSSVEETITAGIEEAKANGILDENDKVVVVK